MPIILILSYFPIVKFLALSQSQISNGLQLGGSVRWSMRALLVLLSSSHSQYPLLMANAKTIRLLPQRHLTPLFCVLANGVSLLCIYMLVSA